MGTLTYNVGEQFWMPQWCNCSFQPWFQTSLLSKIVQIFATAVREKDESNKMAAENVKAVHITESLLIVFLSSPVRHSETHTKYRERTKTHTREYWRMSYQKKKKKCPAKGRNYFSLARRSSNSNVPNLKPRTESVGHLNTPIIDKQGLFID